MIPLLLRRYYDTTLYFSIKRSSVVIPVHKVLKILDHSILLLVLNYIMINGT